MRPLNELLLKKKRRHIPVIAVPMAADEDILGSIAAAMRRNLARFILIGSRRTILRKAGTHRRFAEQCRFISRTDEEAACECAAQLAASGEAQILMKGQVHTASFIRAVLRHEYGLIAHGGLISCASVFSLPSFNKPLLLTDPAVNIAPTLFTKTRILENALGVARRLGSRVPQVACICPVETVNEKIPATLDARELARMAAADEFGSVRVEGPVSLDIALSRRAARIKGIKSRIAGSPDILMMPDLISANVLYKSFVWSGGAQVASVIAGARPPIVLTSRSDSARTRLLSIALAVRMAHR